MNPNSVKSIISGSVSIANANVAVALLTKSQGCIQIVISALPTNVGAVYLGFSGVTTGTGIQLVPTQSVTISIADISKLYIVGVNASDGVSFGYYI